MLRRASLLALGSWACCGCGETIPTQVIVQLHVEPDLAATATELHVSVENDEGTLVLDHDKVLEGLSGRIARIPLHPKGDDPTRRFIVRAELTDGTNSLGRIEARAGYRDGELRTLNLWFSYACRDADCGDGRTCDRGTCRGACFETLPADATDPSRPSCVECERCSNRCEPTPGEPCGCAGDACEGNECVPKDVLRFVAAGVTHTCAVLSSDEVHCWGASEGLGPGWASAAPVAIGATGSFGIAAGHHGCAISQQSRHCWGANDDGELGSTDPSPVTVANTTPQLTRIEVGANHTCGVGLGGELVCWGANDRGQLGIGSATPKGTQNATPQPVGTGYVQVALGGDQSCALEQVGGALRCWGNNFSGQVGVAERTTITSPVAPGCDDPNAPICYDDWIYVGAGGFVSCGIRTGGSLYCWGANVYGERGTGPPYEGSEIHDPTPVATDIQWSQVEGGFRHTCGLDADSRLYCWGWNQDRQLGLPASGFVPTPTLVIDDARFKSVSPGQSHTCAIRDDRTLWCWGNNDSGQIGIGTTGGRVDVPTRVCF